MQNFIPRFKAYFRKTKDPGIRCFIKKCPFWKKKSWFKKKKKTLWPLFMDGVQLPQGYSHFEEAVYFLPFSSQKSLVLILSTSEGWKAGSTLEPPIELKVSKTTSSWEDFTSNCSSGESKCPFARQRCPFIEANGPFSRKIWFNSLF